MTSNRDNLKAVSPYVSVHAPSRHATTYSNSSLVACVMDALLVMLLQEIAAVKRAEEEAMAAAL